MKKILILGATGHLGRVVAQSLLDKKYIVTALVRNPQKLQLTHANLRVVEGSVTEAKDVSKALINVNVVISTLGHGFRTSFPIQEKTLTLLIPLMEKEGITRFITVTGSGLLVKGDPPSAIASLSEKAFRVIDPYRMDDARVQQELLEKSTLEWTVVRTPVHSGGESEAITHAGFTQPPPWKTVPRVAVAAFITQCIQDKKWIKKAPIIY